MNINPEFWKDRRVLVTGHTGFKGGWLCLLLKRLGAKVTGYALPPLMTPNLYEVARIGEEVNAVIGDVRNLDDVCKVVEQSVPEVVFHLAAQPLVRQSYAHPVETYATNVMGTVHLLEAVRRVRGVRALVNVTSDKCYDNQEWLWAYRENEPVGGNDPYSSSKGCAELVTNAFRNSYFHPTNYAQHQVAIATARAGNVIGGGDWSTDRLVPDTIRAILAGNPVCIRNPNAIRPWQHVMEPLAGYVLLAEQLYAFKPNSASAWNFGPTDDGVRSVAWLVERLTREWGAATSWRLDNDTHPPEAVHLKLDSSKARTYLGWKSKLQIEEAVGSLVEWYKADTAGADMKEFTLNQIQSYVSA